MKTGVGVGSSSGRISQSQSTFPQFVIGLVLPFLLVLTPTTLFSLDRIRRNHKRNRTLFSLDRSVLRFLLRLRPRLRCYWIPVETSRKVSRRLCFCKFRVTASILSFSCSSYVGCKPSINPQPVTLESSVCSFRKTIAHEIMHLLGFYHEQTRYDRGQYINYYANNVQSGMATIVNASS